MLWSGKWKVRGPKKTETTQQGRATRKRKQTTRLRMNKTRKKNESIIIPRVEVGS